MQSQKGHNVHIAAVSPVPGLAVSYPAIKIIAANIPVILTPFFTGPINGPTTNILIPLLNNMPYEIQIKFGSSY